MKRIKIYYWYVGLPIAALVAATVVFFDLIVQTMKGNPHPEINYLIFALIIGGSYMMFAQIVRMNREARRIDTFYQTALTKPEPEVLRQRLQGKRHDADEVLNIVCDLIGKPVSGVQHGALESELERFHSVQARYLILPQFLGGMMVGLGLLGTFIGLLGALSEISKLIGAFSTVSGGDPVEAIRVLVERLISPMQAMGVAFSASLFGVLGSLIMGVLLVGVRNCSGTLNSLLDSRATYLAEFTNATESVGDLKGLGDAVSVLAEQSPVLAGLASALEQSERRTRELVNSMVMVTSRLEVNQAGNAALVDAMQARLATEDAALQTMRSTQDTLAQIATRWSNAAQLETQLAGLISDQSQQSERFMQQLETSTQQHAATAERLVGALADAHQQQALAAQNIGALNKALVDFSQETTVKLGDVVGVQRRNADQMAEILINGFKDMAGVQRRGADEFSEVTQTGFRDLAGAQRRSSGELTQQITEQMGRMTDALAAGQNEQSQLTQQISRITDVLASLNTNSQSGISRVVDAYQRNFEKTVREQMETALRMDKVLQDNHTAHMETTKQLEGAVGAIASSLRDDAAKRATTINRLELQLQDFSTRQEQFAQSVSQSLAALTALTAAQAKQRVDAAR